MGEKVIHVHPNKTGGTSIRRTLGLTHQPEHRRAVHLRDHVYPESWKSAYTFAFVRNPFDRVVSMYEYRKRINHRNLKSNRTSFDDWVRAVFYERTGPYFNKAKFFQTCLYWVADGSGKIIVDDAWRFENFESDFNEILSRCQEAGLDVSRVQLHHEKENPKKTPYQDYYSRDFTKRIVTRFFERDLDVFGYTFK